MIEPDDIHDRLAELEARCEKLARSQRRTFLIAGGVLIPCLLLGMATAKSKVEAEAVVARRFLLVDHAGNVRGAWEVGQQGPAFSLRSVEGERLLEARSNDKPTSMASLTLSTPDAKNNLMLLQGGNQSSLSIRGNDGSFRVYVGQMPTGEAKVEVSDPDGNRATLKP